MSRLSHTHIMDDSSLSSFVHFCDWFVCFWFSSVYENQNSSQFISTRCQRMSNFQVIKSFRELSRRSLYLSFRGVIYNNLNATIRNEIEMRKIDAKIEPAPLLHSFDEQSEQDCGSPALAFALQHVWLLFPPFATQPRLTWVWPWFPTINE